MFQIGTNIRNKEGEVQKDEDTRKSQFLPVLILQLVDA